MKEIYEYVERSFTNIPDGPQKIEMMQEVATRLIDAAQHWISEGKARDDAINKAIVDFGDLSEIRSAMNEGDEPEKLAKAYQKHQKAMNRFWFSIVGSGLIILFFMFINSQSSREVWWIYPAFGIIWWPLSVFFFGAWRKGGS